MPRNNIVCFRCTTEEKESILKACKSKNMTIREYLLNAHNNNTGIIDKEGLKILFTKVFEPRFAKRMIRRYCGKN